MNCLIFHPIGAGAVARLSHIGPQMLANPVLLAPMSGVTDAPFRRLAARLGAGLVISEMIASEDLARERPRVLRRTEGAEVRPFVIQLAGREARWMAEGARRRRPSVPISSTSTWAARPGK